MNEIMKDPLAITVFGVWFFIAGLCIGSFLNVVILRGFSNESIVFPPSKCPSCGKKLKWWMNIPVLSYIFLKGKCYFCKKPISLQYPIVELTVGLLFLFVFLKFSFTISTLFYLIGVCLVVVMCVCDIKENVIFDIHSYLLILFGIIFNVVKDGAYGFFTAFSGALTGFLIYEIFARTGSLFLKQRAFGEGDSLIGAGIGAYFGALSAVVSTGLSVLTMGVFTFPYFFIDSYKKGKKKTVEALSFALFLIFFALIVSKFNLIEGLFSSLIFLLIMIFSVIWCIKGIFSDMKSAMGDDGDSEEKFCMLPFGPAMGISFLAVIFFGDEIRNFVVSYFS